MPVQPAPSKPADAEDLLPPGQGERADSPDSMAQHQRGQAGTGQPGLHGAGAVPGKAFAPPPEQPGQPRPPQGGQDPKEAAGGHTVRKPDTLDDEQQRGG
jgi:hypothetical protein